MKPVKHILDLRLSFHADDAQHAARRVRALLKHLLRSWRIRCVSVRWTEESEVDE